MKLNGGAPFIIIQSVLTIRYFTFIAHLNNYPFSEAEDGGDDGYIHFGSQTP
jgi:hypothetical protein